MNKQKLRSLAYIHSSTAFLPEYGQQNCNSSDLSIKRSKRNFVKWCSGCSSKLNLCTCWQSTTTNETSHIANLDSCSGTPRQSPLKDLDISSGTFSVGSPAARRLSLEADNLCVVLEDAQAIGTTEKRFKLPVCASDSCLLINNGDDLPPRPYLLSDFSYVKSAGQSPFSATPSGLGDTLESQSVAESSTTGAGSQTSSSLVCKWYNCDREITCCVTAGEDDRELLLLDHVMTAHIKPQCSRRRKYFTCQWTDCKVYRRPSLSYAWLERHVLSHTGTKSKPFKCIFDCPRRFSTRTLLERHVRSHLPSSPNKINNTHKKLCNSDVLTSQNLTTSVTIIPKRKRRRKKIRGFRVQSIDFYDRRTQAFIKNRVMLASLCIQRSKTPMPSPEESSCTSTPSTSPQRAGSSSIISINGTSALSDEEEEDEDKFVNISEEAKRLLTFPYSVIGKRSLPNRSPELLIKWYSKETFRPDEWVSQSDVTIAQVLGAPRSKGRKCAALRAFHISLSPHT